MSNGPEREAILQIVERRASLDGRFTDLRRLGTRGGDGYFSILVRATDIRTGQPVALKFFNPLKRFSPDAGYRFDCFSREARILETLAGEKDIIRWISPVGHFTEKFTALGGISIDLPFAYFGLELGETDIESAIMRAEMKPVEILDAFHVMCRAVQRLHARGYVHRDLKPSNFLIMRDGTLRLSDFGTARQPEDTGAPFSSNYVLPPGDRRYAAPEILACLLDDDARIAYAADLFGLGAILFEMITGTVLGLHIFDENFRRQLTSEMASVARGQRTARYNEIVGSIADSHPLPNLAAFSPDVPKSVLPLVDGLYKSLASVDYRKRLIAFDRIFLRIQTSLIVLRNEVKYQQWQERRETFRKARERKLTERKQKVEPLPGGVAR